VTVGLSLEGDWMERLLKNAAADPSRVLALGEAVDPVPFQGRRHNAAGEAGHDDDAHGAYDPHFWWDPMRVKATLPLLVSRLSQLDPAGAATYDARAKEYAAELDALHRWALQEIERLPQERRLLVTSHDGFGYLARTYGLRLIATVIPGGSTAHEPSAAELGTVVSNIRSYQVPAVFAEAILNDRLARRVSEEAGVRIVTGLYSDSLGPAGSGADTYTGMFRQNLRTIVDVLR
jgi:ABC-type Zn uptake system ZnuABC Zn-binding protein ZnuA